MFTGREDARATPPMLGAQRRDERVVVRGRVEVGELGRGDALVRQLRLVDKDHVELIQHFGRAPLAM